MHVVVIVVTHFCHAEKETETMNGDDYEEHDRSVGVARNNL
jgi:hypothetical protein